ncbi:MAG: heavy metal translocating P-type ATPase [candidate division Zixibacteria bacterium]|nr:heavy metal translocating P-type ATPase [candidate division Zixibacteria bacterium]
MNTHDHSACSCSDGSCQGSPSGHGLLRGREFMCVLSGVLLLVGFVIHAVDGGFVAALASDGVPRRATGVLYLAAIVAGWWFVAPSALRSLRQLRADINLLMTIAVIGAVAIGEYFEAATVSFLYALSLLMESWSVGRARRAIGALLDLKPLSARVVDSGNVVETPVEQVVPKARVQVRPGEKIPLDGIVVSGTTSVNQSPITGEATPATKTIGDEVYAGTINNEGAFEFTVTKSSRDSALARIIQMVEQAQSRRAPVEQWIQTFARYYTPAMLSAAILVAVVPPLAAGADWSHWLYSALVMLVISCPCALLVSTSVSIMAALTSAARAGVLIKGGVYLEIPSKLKAVALDKTGTLTRGHPEVQHVDPLNNHTPEELLARAASLERLSEHPLARAVVRRAEVMNVATFPVTGFRVVQGRGAEALLNGRRFWIGSHRYTHERADEPEVFHRKAVQYEAAGQSVIAVGNDNHICGLISVADQARPEAAIAIAALKQDGVAHVVMLTGDNEGTARAVAEAVGADAYHAELLPADKVAEVERLVQEYGVVAMVGDGVNDAPALAAATVGIAMGAAGTDAAIETADIALMSDDLSRLPWLVKHSRRTLRMIKTNVVFALGVKTVFMILAFFDLATLWMAIFADMGVTLLVVFNSLRLLRTRLP